jgi:hypothetical protein
MMRSVVSETRSRSTRVASEGPGRAAPAAARSARLLDLLPERHQVLDVGAELGLGRGSATVRTMKPPVSPGRDQRMHLLAQVLALGLVLDALRDADVRVLRQVHEQAARRSTWVESRAPLLPMGSLTTCTSSVWPSERIFSIGPLDAAAVAGHPDVGHVQEGRARQPDLDEADCMPGARGRRARDRCCRPGRGSSRARRASSCTAPSSVTATRVSCGVTFMRICSFISLTAVAAVIPQYSKRLVPDTGPLPRIVAGGWPSRKAAIP